MQAHVDGKTVSVLFLPPPAQKYRLIGGVCKALVIGGVGLAAAFVAGGAGKADAMVLALISGFAGSAMAGLLLQWFRRRVLFQVRDRYARTAETTFGGVGRRSAPWQRHPLFPTHAIKLLSQRRFGTEDTSLQLLSRTELRWLNDVLAGGNGGGRSIQAVRPNALRLSAQPPARLPENVGFLAVEMQFENRSHAPVLVGAVEDLQAGRTWHATIDGHPAELFLSRTERERLVAPGRTVVCRGKIFPGKTVSAKEEVLVELSCGEIRGEPFWYPLVAGGQRVCA
jgi:hypothetical protein